MRHKPSVNANIFIKIAGFTLIELSIVLVIIGLVVGGVLVGQDLIHSAQLRSQVTQLEKLNSAATAFRLKYNALPGDILRDDAISLDLYTASSIAQDLDYSRLITDDNGDGLIGEKLVGTNQVVYKYQGEMAMFFRHLSDANIIEGSYGADLDNQAISNGTPNTRLPEAKLGNGQFITVTHYMGANRYIISDISSIVNTFRYINATSISMSTSDAYNIDVKIDDGKPMSGNVVSMFIPQSDDILTLGDNSNNPECVTIASEYNLTDTSLACSVMVKAAF